MTLLTSSTECVIRTHLTDDLKTYQALNASNIKTGRINLSPTRPGMTGKSPCFVSFFIIITFFSVFNRL